MANKIAFFFLALVVTGFLGVLGWVLLATWGGGYAEDFIAFGTRGYEATGIIGWWVGIVIGVVASIFVYKRIFKSTQ
ncbi:MAG: hypothetical protein AAB460_00335 [Patescibacteria group bacterium]